MFMLCYYFRPEKGACECNRKRWKYNVASLVTVLTKKKTPAADLRRDNNEAHWSSPAFTRLHQSSLKFKVIALNVIGSIDSPWNYISIHSVRLLWNVPENRGKRKISTSRRDRWYLHLKRGVRRTTRQQSTMETASKQCTKCRHI